MTGPSTATHDRGTDDMANDDMASDNSGPTSGSVGEGRGYTVGSFLMAAFAVALLPLLFGPIGVVLGLVGMRKGDPLGRVSALTAAAATVLGLLLSTVLAIT